MTRAVAAATAAGIEFSVHRYEHTPGTESFGLEAADALGLPPAQVLKTLVADAGEAGLALAIVPVDSRLDLKALAAALGVKRASMAEPRAAERATGYVVGGISPLGAKRRLPAVLDRSAFGFAIVYVSAGQRGIDIGLAPGDLERLTGARRATIARR